MNRWNPIIQLWLAIITVASCVLACTPVAKVSPPIASSQWLSGSEGDGVWDRSNDFAVWRGEPLAIAGVQSSGAIENQICLCQWFEPGGEFDGWSQSIDVTVGAIFNFEGKAEAGTNGETWAQAAQGAYDERWSTSMKKLDATWGNKKLVYVRFAHEMSGDWYHWRVNSSNAADFITAWQRFHAIMRRDAPRAKLVWCPANGGVYSDISTPQMWPGDDYVDVVCTDFFDNYPKLSTDALWDAHYMDTENGSPLGIGAWLEFARKHGKQFALGEWGLGRVDGSGGAVDNPVFIRRMHEFFVANAGPGPGQVLYEIYFNVDYRVAGNGEIDYRVYPEDVHPNAAAMYKSLSWGRHPG